MSSKDNLYIQIVERLKKKSGCKLRDNNATALKGQFSRQDLGGHSDNCGCVQ